MKDPKCKLFINFFKEQPSISKVYRSGMDNRLDVALAELWPLKKAR